MSFELLGLQPALCRALATKGYTEPTPIQAKAIPEVLAGHDLLAAAQTGTGKTAGFTLPILQRLFPEGGDAARRRPRAMRVLVLTPTRELAQQVLDSVRAYGQQLPAKACVIFGGVGMQPQVNSMRGGQDIVVATPGRLLDHVRQGTIDLGHVETLVLDEADRMLDMGFIHDIRRIVSALPKSRQTLLFSATFSNEIRALAQDFLRNPAEVDVAPRNSTTELVRQQVHGVPKARKRDLLVKLIEDGQWHQVLVFTRTKHGANRLAEQLDKAGIHADAIHGNKSQTARVRALNGFKTGAVRVLVATDIAARGLDIRELPRVVNYELPNVPEDYVHRIGRTGRAGASGIALSLVDGEETKFLAQIERLIGQKIERIVVEGFENDAKELLRTGSAPSRNEAPRRNPGHRTEGRHRSTGQARAAEGTAHPHRRDGNRPARGGGGQRSGSRRAS